LLLLATKVWEQRQLREISSSTIGGGTPKSSNKKFWNGNIPWIQSSDLVNGDIWNITIKKHITLDAVENSAAKIISANSIAVVTRVAVGKLVYMPLEYATSQDFISFQNLSGDHSFFMYLVSKVMHKVKGSLQGTSIKGISKGELLKKKVIYTLNIKEQKKIGTLLKSLDTILTLYERKLKLLSKTKKYFLQKLFVNGDQKHPVIRFREFNDDWKEKKLAQLFKISNETNLDNKLCFSKQDVLSVSDKFGVVNQIKLQGRSFAGNNISKYKVVRNNQIVYTKSPLKDKPYGIIKIVSNIKGIVSPLYIVNNVIGNNAWFIYYYFDLKSRTNNYLKPLVRLGAKHTMNITDKEWLSGKIFISEVIQEQEKIANLLNMIDKLIRLNEQQLRNLEELKKCLLQNMFC